MITLNLLPDVKKEYIKSNRTKNMVMMVAFFVSVTSISVVVLMSLYVFGVQKLQIANSQGSIDQSIETIRGTEDLDKIVTVQKQILTLPTLHEGITSASRLFSFLEIVTPNSVSLSEVDINYETNTMELKGGGEDFKAVNTFVDTLKNASYIYANNNDKTLAFSNVVLDSIGVNNDGDSSFKVTMEFKPNIFDINVEGLKLTVPNITSSRSQTEKPKSLFDGEETPQ